MQTSSPFVRFTLTAIAWGLMSCATTKVTSTWKDPAADSTPINRVLVVGLVPQEALRRNLEDKLARGLHAKGTEAIPSSSFLQNGASLTKEAIRRIVETQGFDAVLVAQYQGTERELDYQPGTYDDYFGYMTPLVYDPGYVTETEEVKFESRLFDTQTGGKMLWSATTSTFDPSSTAQAIPSVADKIVSQLEKDVRI